MAQPWSKGGSGCSPTAGYAAAPSTACVSVLIEAIELSAEHWNNDPKPFVWKKTAEEIIEKVHRGRATLTETKSATHH